MTIKNKQAVEKMRVAGRLLAEIFENIDSIIQEGASTLSIDRWIEQELTKRQLVSQSKGYKGYNYVSCVSINDVVVHGVPSAHTILRHGDLVKIDVCAAWQLYCADMARAYEVGCDKDMIENHLIVVAKQALDVGIAQAAPGNRLFDISAAIQNIVEQHKYGVIRDFAGHGIGRQMHEDPDVPNFGTAGTGMRLQVGMTFAIEPMITQGSYEVYVDQDGWAVKTRDKSLTAHVEDTVLVGEHGPEILTRLSQ